MKCTEIQPSLLEYGRGLLSGPEARRVKSHLDKCVRCKILLAEELAFAGRLAALPVDEPANDVWALVRARTKPSPLSLRGLRTLLSGHSLVRKAIAFAAAAGMVLGALYVELKPEEPKTVVKKQAATAVAVGWSDDPIGDHTDAVVAFIDDL